MPKAASRLQSRRSCRTLGPGSGRLHHYKVRTKYSISGSAFYGVPVRHIAHKRWRLLVAPRESVRGAVRGAATRECLLHASSAKSAQRRIRKRLVAAYVRRFGFDEFVSRFIASRIASRKKSNWLPGGYASWREQIFGRVPERDDWPPLPKKPPNAET